MLCELKIQFERHMNEGKYHLAEPLITAICALNKTEGLFRYACWGPFLNISHLLTLEELKGRVY